MTVTVFWCKFGFGRCFGVSSQSNQPLNHCWLSYKIHFSLHVTIQWRNGSLLHQIRDDNTSKWRFFKCSIRSWGTHSIRPFHLSDLLQMLNDCRMVEFFGKRVSFDDALSWWLSASDGRPLCSSSSEFSSPLQSFLDHHCTVRSLAVPGQNAWVDAASCFHCFTTHLEFE